MKKTILIFGAGLHQYTLIKAAKNLGVTSIVLDPNPDSPGKDIADYFYVVEGRDYRTTREIAVRHKVVGLATTQLEKPLRLMARLAVDFDLPFHSPEVVARSLDKWLMKQAFKQHGVPCARGYLFQKDELIRQEDINDLAFPLIMKPKDATSSQGVFKVDDYDQIPRNRDQTNRFSKNGEVIIEEFLEGPEYSIESITFRGKTTIVQYTEKFITPFPHTVEMGHLQPADLTQRQKQEIDVVVKDAIKAIGIDNSAAHTEIKFTIDGPKVVEIGARGGGDFISSYLTSASTGVNMDEAMIKVALGEMPDLLPTKSMYSYMKYFSLPVGKIVQDIEDYSDILNDENIVFAHINVQKGGVIEEITESKKRPGFALVKAKDRKNVLEIADSYIDKLVVKIKM